mgnify:CR=1 FL=1
MPATLIKDISITKSLSLKGFQTANGVQPSTQDSSPVPFTVIYYAKILEKVNRLYFPKFPYLRNKKPCIPHCKYHKCRPEQPKANTRHHV